ncbi:MAG: hypothetical protein E7613_00045 [Ruminococcaceae bacterium]|nr:hypothetical protein [Oscillospiraceae bacterium]
MKRIIALFLVIVSVFSFAACTDTEETEKAKPGEAAANNTKTEMLGDDIVMECGETKLPGAAYYAQLFSTKMDILTAYLGLTEDDPKIWSQDSPEGRAETFGESMTRTVIEDMVQFVWVVEYARKNGVTLQYEDKVKIDEAYNTYRAEFETEEEFLSYLGSLKFTEESIRKYLELTLMYDKGFDLLVAEGADYYVADEVFDKYYTDNFYTVKHIFINDVYKEDEEGNPIELTEEEKAEKKEKFDNICADLGDGVDFETLYLLSEDEMSVKYPDGFTLTDGLAEAGYMDALKKLKPGEYTTFNGVNGGMYVIFREELSEADRENYDEFITSVVYEDTQYDIYVDHKPEVTIHEDIIALCKIEDIPVV